MWHNNLLLALLLMLGAAWAQTPRDYAEATDICILSADEALQRVLLRCGRTRLLVHEANGREWSPPAFPLSLLCGAEPLTGNRLLVWGQDAAGRTRWWLLTGEQERRELRPPGLGTWSDPVQRLDGDRLLLQSGEVPTATAPLLLLEDVAGEFRLRPFYDNPRGALAWAFAPDGRLLGELCWRPDGSKQLLNAAGEELLRAGSEDQLQLIGTLGDRELLLRHDVGHRAAVLTRLNPRNGQSVDLASHGNFNVTGPVFAGREPVGFCALTESHCFHPLRALPLRRALRSDMLPLRFSPDGRRALVCLSGRGLPERYALLSEQGLEHIAAETHKSLPPMRPMHYAAYPARDGTRIPLYYTTPEGGGPWPTVLFVHGGPRMRTSDAYDWRVQYLVSRGFAVAQPQFRGSDGWGRRFRTAGYRQWGLGLSQSDVNDAVPWLVRQGIAREGAVAIFGGSYGGYAATAGLCFTPELYACGISLFGIQDVLQHLTERYNPANSELAGEERALVGDPVTEAERLRAISPALHAERITRPLLLVWGEKDTLIPPSHSRRLAEAMRAAGNPPECIVYADEAHGFADPKHEYALYERMVDFLQRHLSPGLEDQRRERR